MKRTDLQRLARVRIEDSRVLLDAGRYAAAYYLAGYAVECGLKAAIAKLTLRSDFPPRVAFVRSVYSHELVGLVKAAGLELQLGAEEVADALFAANWATVKDWSPDDRYMGRPAQDAADIYAAVVQRNHGVMRWIRQYW